MADVVIGLFLSVLLTGFLFLTEIFFG